MKFVNSSGNLQLLHNGKTVFTSLRAYIMTEENKKTYIPFNFSSDGTANFSLPEKNIILSTEIISKSGLYALKIKASYVAKNCFEEKNNIHFYEEHAVGIEMVPVDTVGNYTSIYRGSEFWARVFIDCDFKNVKPSTQSLLLNYGSKKLFINAVCDKEFKANMESAENGFSLYVFNNCLSNECDTFACVFGFGDNEYELIPTVIKFAFEITGRKPRMREDKPFPDVLEYFGWCSWDAFHIDVSEDLLLKKAEEFKKKEIPVKWIMIDDMWGDVNSNALGVNSTRELNSFEADPDRFPDGLKPTVTKLKKYGLKVGLWHPTTGYWNGIDPNGEIAKDPRYKSLIYWSQAGKLVHSFEKKKIQKYYNRQHKFYKKCGIDLIKVDNQACLRLYSKRVMPIGRAAENLHTAIEKSANKNFGGKLINCMGMPLENFYNRNSAVIRTSCDYLPDSRERFNLTVRQNIFNGMVQGSAYYGDFDMWWTYDSQALKNALLHSVCGGPVYISDELDKTDYDIIKPLLLKDGKVLRMKNRPLPTRDCLYTDSTKSGKPFKIFNTSGENGVVLAYNIDEAGKTVSGEICATDAQLDPNRNYCAYNRLTGEAIEVRGDEKINVTLEENDVFMYLFIPIPQEEKEAIIGLKEKYVCFEAIKNGISLDNGTLLRFKNGKIYETPIDIGQKV